VTASQTPRPTTPAQAWEAMTAGNSRFVRSEPAHPDQDAAHRAEVAQGQHPFATVFGCSDSRVAAEIVFDQGLGDLFVVRTAGHVVDTGVLGSLEFGSAVLGIPLVVVLGHDRCGAVSATLDAVGTGEVPGGFLRDVVERVTPSVLSAQHHHDGAPSVDDVEVAHVQHTARLLTERSQVLARAVADGRCAVVGLVYRLVDGRVRLVHLDGDVGGDQPGTDVVQHAPRDAGDTAATAG
jgi:carbonic anhydrase